MIIGPCYNTPGCVLPECCGLVAGLSYNSSLTYKAIIDVTNGTFQAAFDNITVTTPTDDPLSVFVPLNVQAPQALFSVLEENTDFCYNPPNFTSNVCPQTVGTEYTYTAFGTVPLVAGLTSVNNLFNIF